MGKPEVKERKALTVAKKADSIHKNTSTKVLKERHESVNDKKLFHFTQPLPNKRQS